MKTILAFGDSLTFGANAETGLRHAYEDRWPTALERGLGGAARVIPEGLGGRTTVFDDYSSVADRNGAKVLPTLLDTHRPLDLVIIFLGTNDLKVYLNGTVGPRHVRRLILIQRKVGRRWVTIARVRTTRRSTFKLVRKAPAKRALFRARIAADREHLANISRTRRA